jgi:hypothetical protein
MATLYVRRQFLRVKISQAKAKLTNYPWIRSGQARSEIWVLVLDTRTYADALLRLGDSFERPCKTMKPFFPKRFVSPLILLAFPASLGSASFPTNLVLAR